MTMLPTDFGPLFLSLRVALTSTFLVFCTGLLFARLFAKKEFVGKGVIESLFLLPLVLPPTVVGFGLLFLLGRNGFLGSWLYEVFGIQIIFTPLAAVFASSIVAFPLMYNSALAAFKNIDSNLENAARTMGAGEWKVFWTISFPLAWPGLLAGVILTFARALGEFGATLMVAGYIPGRTDTIPMAIYFAVESGNNALATFWVFTVTTVGFSTLLWLNWWSKRGLERYRMERKR